MEIVVTDLKHHLRLLGRRDSKGFRKKNKKMKKKLLFCPLLVAPQKNKITCHLAKVAEHTFTQTPHSYVATYVSFITCC